jgi:hypothetical protein
MKKHHLYISLFILTLLFTQCKDESVTPARNQLIIVFPHDSIIKVNLVNCIADGDFDPGYCVGAESANSSDYGLTLCSPGGASSSNFPNQTNGISLGVGNNKDTWNASSGYVGINVVHSFMDLGRTKVSIEFSNVQFTNASGKPGTITVSGNVHCN